jgi:hypothetical protein
MKEKFKIQEDSGFKITLGSNGLTPAGAFFIGISLTFLAFLTYAIIAFSLSAVPTSNAIFAFAVMVMVFFSSLILFLIAYSLSNEVQEISLDDNQLMIRKHRPLWPGVAQTINLDQIDGFAMEKLGFNFMNVWYAFIFHKDFGADEVENFLSPQVRIAGKGISFLEYADEKSKKIAVEKLKKFMRV